MDFFHKYPSVSFILQQIFIIVDDKILSLVLLVPLTELYSQVLIQKISHDNIKINFMNGSLMSRNSYTSKNKMDLSESAICIW